MSAEQKKLESGATGVSQDHNENDPLTKLLQAMNISGQSRRTRLSSAGSTDVSALQNQLEDDVVQEALRSGIDFRQYSKQIENELKKVESDAVKDYIKEAENIANLHNEIVACDHILQRMEDMLSGFQHDLGSISSDIENLQDQSVLMNLKLRNRQGVRGELSQFVDEMVVSDSMIQHILETPVTEREFLEQLHELQHKINFVKEQAFRDAKATLDIQDILEKLKFKAIAKIREFMLQKIAQFRKPLANYQIPQDTLLKFRFYFEFLLANERQTAQEIKSEYVDTVSKMFYSYFKTYAGRLLRLQFEDVATKDDLLAAEDTSKSSFWTAARTTRSRATVFTLGNRAAVLKEDLEKPIIVPHVAQENSQKFPLEALFRSLQFSLVDNACREFLFLSDFFIVTGQTANEIFGQVMGKALEVVSKTVAVAIAESHDALALLLCIQIVQRFKIIMLNRNVPALDRYWSTLLEANLWPRFDHIMHLHIESVKNADPERFAANLDTPPHYIVRRYAEFSAALVTLNQTYPDEKLSKILAILQQEIEAFVLRLASGFRQRKQQLIFFINNYHLMLTVLTERASEESTEAANCKELLIGRQKEFVEAILSPHCGQLMKFVRESELLIEHGQLEQLKKYFNSVSPIAEQFSVNYKKWIEVMQQEIMTSFSDLTNGSNILQLALTQLVEYYHRFVQICGHQTFQNCPGQQKLINVHQIMVEVKKYKRPY